MVLHGPHLLLVEGSQHVGAKQLWIVLRGHPATPFKATCCPANVSRSARNA